MGTSRMPGEVEDQSLPDVASSTSGDPLIGITLANGKARSYGNSLELSHTTPNGHTPNGIGSHSEVVVTGEETHGSSSKQCCPCVQKPEGRDAWLIAIMCSVMSFCISSEVSSFGIYYVEYTEYFGVSKSVVGWIKGIQTITAGLVGIVGSSFVKVYGCRVIGCVAIFLIFVGFLASSFASNVYMLYLTHGVIVGIGMTLAHMSVAVITQCHFVRNPVLGTGVAYTGFTIGGFCTPLLVTYLLREYGLRGCLMLHATLVCQGLAAALMLRPVVKKMKLAPHQNGSCKPCAARPSQTADKEGVSLLRQIADDMCDFSLLRDPLMVMFCVASVLWFYDVSSFISHLPGRAVFHNIPLDKAAYLQSAASCAALAARVPSTFLANFRKVNKILYISIGIALIGASSISYSLCTTFTGMFVAPFLFGLGMGSAMTVHSVVLVRLFTLEKLPRSFGLINLANQIGLSIGPPASGYIFDRTGNYDYPFVLGGLAAIIACIITVTIYFLDKRRRQKAEAALRAADTEAPTDTDVNYVDDNAI